MKLERLLTFALVGFVAQLIDGALGMAYGVTASSLLLSGGTAAATASASVHLAEIGTTFASGASHWRFGNVNWRTVRWIGIPGAAGAFIGATTLSNLNGEAVTPYVSGVLMALGLYIIVRFAFGVTRRPLAPEHLRGRFLAPLGTFGGFIDAIGGGGWGPVTTPALMTAGRMAPHTAVGSASASEFLVTVAASAGFVANLGTSGIDGWIVVGLLVGGVAAAPLAAYVVRRLPPQVLGTMVGVLIIVVNGRTLMVVNDVAGPIRLTVLVLGTVVGALLVIRSALVVRATRIVRVGDTAHRPDEMDSIELDK
ncbi:MAG: sulfite exporter TauE/SafE family protein [Acidimicrobiia bacterium]